MTYLIIILLILLLLLSCKWISDKNKENTLLEIQSKVLNTELDVANDIADYYRSLYLKYCIYQTNKNTNNPNNQQILDAVKYAMKKSHPDNGGSAEDFKKFRDLYNSMK